MIARWSPLGESAVLAWCSNEDAAATLADAVRQSNAPWLVDVVQAYSSVAVFFERDAITAANLIDRVKSLNIASTDRSPSRRHRIPVCYERSLDLDRVAARVQLDREAIIRLHLDTVYRVYAIGFCPGFPYLGYLPDRLSNVPRLPSPRVRVDAGSVGLTGRQTGIYTEARPGGWNIIGQTPLELVNVADGYFPLHTGDEVTFQRIDDNTYSLIEGERLSVANLGARFHHLPHDD